jgi:hypothetical protein
LLGFTFVKYALIENFDVNFIKKNSHWFGHNDEFSEEEIESTLYIYVVREPVEWIDSFFKRLHHIPPENKKKIENFVKNEWYSIYEECEQNGKEIMEDRNIYTKERYKNIFELRKIKNEYMIHTLKHKFKHFLLLRYEDLRDRYNETLHFIKNKFQLKVKNDSSEYKKIIKYKGTYIALYVKKPILLTPEMQEYIRHRVDIQQEHDLGYLLDYTKPEQNEKED